MAKRVSGMSAQSAAQRIRHLEKLVDDATRAVALLEARNAELTAELDQALSQLALLKEADPMKQKQEANK
ncbi:TPA: hypothetical protein ACOEOW_003897 [Enterobacter hormaechei subsp. xiangfangensis]